MGSRLCFFCAVKSCSLGCTAFLYALRYNYQINFARLETRVFALCYIGYFMPQKPLDMRMACGRLFANGKQKAPQGRGFGSLPEYRTPTRLMSSGLWNKLAVALFYEKRNYRCCISYFNGF